MRHHSEQGRRIGDLRLSLLYHLLRERSREKGGGVVVEEHLHDGTAVPAGVSGSYTLYISTKPPKR